MPQTQSYHHSAHPSAKVGAKENGLFIKASPICFALQKLLIKALITWGLFSALDHPSGGCGRRFFKECTQMHPSHNPKAALQVREALERQTLANASLSKYKPLAVAWLCLCSCWILSKLQIGEGDWLEQQSFVQILVPLEPSLCPRDILVIISPHHHFEQYQGRKPPLEVWGLSPGAAPKWEDCWGHTGRGDTWYI